MEALTIYTHETNKYISILDKMTEDLRENIKMDEESRILINKHINIVQKNLTFILNEIVLTKTKKEMVIPEDKSDNGDYIESITLNSNIEDVGMYKGKRVFYTKNNKPYIRPNNTIICLNGKVYDLKMNKLHLWKFSYKKKSLLKLKNCILMPIRNYKNSLKFVPDKKLAIYDPSGKYYKIEMGDSKKRSFYIGKDYFLYDNLGKKFAKSLDKNGEVYMNWVVDNRNN